MKTVTLIPGDGIGPEITASVVAIFEAANIPIRWETIECGIHIFEKSGVLIPKALAASLNTNKVALKGPTTTPVGGGHRSINVTLRQTHKLFANVRPVKSFANLTCVSDDVDLIIVRENSEDLYKGVEYKVNDDTAHGIKIITRSASERIGRHAFELAKRLGRKQVTAVHKANIMKLTDGLFLDSIRDVSKDYPSIKFNDIIVDNCCMQLVTRPAQFDVIVTENLYGDILSDLSSGLVGGLGLAAGANIGEEKAVFEAVHGSAPDIAGQNKANPTALILSSVMMLRHMDLLPEALKIENAVLKTLNNPATRTGDLNGNLGTKELTQAIIANL